MVTDGSHLFVNNIGYSISEKKKKLYTFNTKPKWGNRDLR